MKRILPVIIISQFCCTSLWFAGNAVMNDIALQFQLSPNYLSYLTNAVQLGFIAGTLIFAILTIADRFSPVKVFCTCAIVGAMFNLGIILIGNSTAALLVFRFLTGFFLAGIYPVGMKIATDHYQKGLGKSLGFLVGALVLGTAFPHLLKSLFTSLPWKMVIIATSSLAVFGGFLILILVPNGPYRRTTQKLKFNSFLQNFKNKNFTSASFGYFGHMWELYTFWVFVPVMLTGVNSHANAEINVPLTSFVIILAGSASCSLSGLLSNRFKPERIASFCLAISCVCCLASPILFYSKEPISIVIFLLIWSMAVVADSPMLSTLVAQSVTAEKKGTALTIVNCIGFAITIVSIQLITMLRTTANSNYIFILLAIGPAFGLFALLRKNSAMKVG